MQGHKWKCAIKFFEGVATSVSAHVAAWMAVASITFVWQFTGHVVADAGFHIATIFAGH
ncbi:MAG: hypothetical protein ABSD08_16550 [Xanthobacteraceae bacterium]|jgi:hypothetical protein